MRKDQADSSPVLYRSILDESTPTAGLSLLLLSRPPLEPGVHLLARLLRPNVDGRDPPGLAGNRKSEASKFEEGSSRPVPACQPRYKGRGGRFKSKRKMVGERESLENDARMFRVRDAEHHDLL